MTSTSTDDLRRIAHDPEAFSALYLGHVEDIQRFVARRVHDPQLAADLTADVFVAAIESAGSYRPSRGRPIAWLFGVARIVVGAECASFCRDVREFPCIFRIVGRRGTRKLLEALVRGGRAGDNGELQKGPGMACHGTARDRERGAADMSGAHLRPALAGYRDAVTDLMRAGRAFRDVEDSIDRVNDLTLDEKAALWLFAFSLRDPSEQQLEAHAHLAAVQ